jgi:antitoxin VapB
LIVPVQITNQQVIEKIKRLCRLTGLGETAAVEAAVDRMLSEFAVDALSDPWAGVDEIVAQLHRIPTRLDSFEAVEYDETGLPR